MANTHCYVQIILTFPSIHAAAFFTDPWKCFILFVENNLENSQNIHSAGQDLNPGPP
jgi:hypothetical protein